MEPVVNPERMKFKPADLKAALKVREKGNKREAAAAAVRKKALEEHFSQADVDGLVAAETGEVPKGMFGGIGDKPIPGKKGKTRVFHVDGQPISPDRLMYIGYANTDEGRADEDLKAKMAADDAAAQKRVHVGSGPWEKNILRRVDILNKAHGEMSNEARALLAELDTTDPRKDIEKAYCPKGFRAKWFGNGERITPGYVVAKTESGDPAGCHNMVMAVVREEVIAQVEEHMVGKRKQKYDQHRSGVADEALKESAKKAGAQVADFEAPKSGRDDLGLYDTVETQNEGESMVNLGEHIQDAEAGDYNRDLGDYKREF